ncbi:MAG: HRDC domain-containing protein [Candidatus Marinimicrobia bacterium]|nr:HRDC domain-containing protein [Candidatus Neomarinimicrobiota bacterium]
MKQPNEYINNYEKSISLMVLSCINDLEFKVGNKKLIAILQGSESNYIFTNEFNNNPFYGLLQNYNSNQISTIIERLVELELVESKKLDLEYYMSVFDLTSKGKAALQSGDLATPYLSNKLFKLNPTIFSDDNKILFERLRKVRKEIAKSINKPAFIVCSDKVLRQITLKLPKNEESLLAIKGIGEHFIQNYSSLFLNEIELNQPESQYANSSRLMW